MGYKDDNYSSRVCNHHPETCTCRDWDINEKPKQETLEEVAENLEEQSTFVKTDNVDGEWLSPIATERAWQEEQLVNIFSHYPNASPRWQYMNGLIQNSLQQERMYSEEDLRKAFENGVGSGKYQQEYGIKGSMNFEDWFEQFKNK